MDAIFLAAKWDENFSVSWKEVLAVFENMPVIDPGKITFGKINQEKIEEILVVNHDFSRERVSIAIDKIAKEQANSQKGLGDWF